MWNHDWREETWSGLEKTWDLIVIGGGITGAGIIRQATQAGLRCLLLEANDFSFGTSSRSSKLVHGGFRYMRNRQFDVTRESVRERQWLLRAAPGLVKPLTFILPNYAGYHTPNWQFQVGVILYDLFAPKWKHRTYTAQQVEKLSSEINTLGLMRAFCYEDANVDDARLVLRILREAAQNGACVLNYARVVDLQRDAHGQVCGVVLQDQAQKSGKTLTAQGKVIINATGPWTDQIRQLHSLSQRIRQQRGSHLVFSNKRFPLHYSFTLMHPTDRRAMFAIPWENVTIIGTTDLDHTYDLDQNEPMISQDEIDYLLEAVQSTFPGYDIQREDILCTFAGVRPIIKSGVGDPSAQSRAHQVWEEDGLFTITGGKLTTFRVMAQALLNAIQPHFAGISLPASRKTMFKPLPKLVPYPPLEETAVGYLLGRHAEETVQALTCGDEDELQPIAELPNLWVELRWSARAEGVVHLDDLLLRRVRLGLQLPEGGKGCMDRIKAICQVELGWDNARWSSEEKRYMEIWKHYYSPTPDNAFLLEQPVAIRQEAH